MITLEIILLWLKSRLGDANYTRGWIDGLKEKSIALYDRQSPPKRQTMNNNGSYKVSNYSLLIQWTKNKDETEAKAIEVYKALERLSDFEIGDFKIVALNLTYEHPLSLGKNDHKLYEYTIEFSLIYKEK